MHISRPWRHVWNCVPKSGVGPFPAVRILRCPQPPLKLPLDHRDDPQELCLVRLAAPGGGGQVPHGPRVDELGVEPQVGPGPAGEVAAPEHRDLLAERRAQLRHARAAHLLHAELGGDPLDLAGEDAVGLHLADAGRQRGVGPRPAPDDAVNDERVVAATSAESGQTLFVGDL